MTASSIPRRSARRRSAGRETSGFSMIEIMAVMIILGIVLMAIVPSIDGLVPKYRLRGGAREVAALIEEAQSQAISSRKEWNVAFDLDHHTFWLIMPPKERAQDPAADPADGPVAAPGSAESEVGKEGRPKDDVEHGLPPVDPAAPQDEDQAEEEAVADRDSIEPMRLPTSVVFEAVIVGDEEKTAGVVYVPFSHLGGTGTTLVGMKLSDEREAAPVWVRFNALTRTIEYADERPEVKTLSGSGDAAGGGPR